MRGLCKNILFIISVIIFPLVFITINMWPVDWGVYPQYYSGDDAQVIFATRLVMEYGYSYFMNDSLGYPFGMDWRNIPPNDIVQIFLIKFFNLFSDDPAFISTLLYIVSFAIAALVCFIVLRKLNINNLIAFIVAQLYAFIPFHIFAAGHLSLSFYYALPVAVFYALKLAVSEDYTAEIFKNKKTLLVHAAVLVLSVQTSLYMIVVFLLIIGIGILAYIFRKGISFKSARVLFIPLVIFCGIGLNWAPVIFAKITADMPESIKVNTRVVSESELYAGRLSQLLLPLEGHRIKDLGAVTKRYYDEINRTYVTENIRSYLGIISAGMFIFSLLWLLRFNRRILWTREISFLSVLNVLLFFWFTIGGFGVLFAFFVTPIIRAWGRLSVGINSVCLIMFAILLQAFYINYIAGSLKKRIAFGAALLLILSCGLWDQVVPRTAYSERVSAAYKGDKSFYRDLASKLPAGSPVYQLPYLPMPYSNKLLYKELEAYTYAPELKWNIGSLSGFLGHSFYSLMETQPIEKQIEMLKEMGFKAIMVYKDAYGDSWDSFFAELKIILGDPFLVNQNDSIYVFSIPGEWNGLEEAKAAANTVLKDWAFNIDFSLPLFVEASGLSGRENWGRWSEGDLVILTFPVDLPQKFIFEMTCDGFYDNAQKPAKMIVDGKEYDIICDGREHSIYVESSKSVREIKFIPAHPVVIRDVTGGSDGRKVAIGFKKLRIIEDNGNSN